MSTSTPFSNDGLPPGRLGVPVLGETLAIARNNHGFYVDRFKRYGPVFKTRLFGKNFVVFVGPEAVAYFLAEPTFDRDGGNPITVTGLMQRSIGMIDGPTHRARKRVMLKAFEPPALARYGQIMERVIQPRLDRWLAAGTVSWRDEFHELSGAITAAMYFSGEPDVAPRLLDQTVETMRLGITAPPLNLRWNTFGRAVRARDRIMGWIDEAIASHHRRSFGDMLSEFMDARGEDGRPLSDQEIRSDCLHLVFATQGGVSVTMTLLALVLGKYPEVMRRAREEVLAIAPDGPVTLERLQRMEYLERLSRELRRIYPINSATFFARVTRPVEYGGYRIPAGWRAAAALHATMIDPATWPDPDRFDPDRFLPERVSKRPEMAYIPHGGGPREGHKCPAEDWTSVLVKVGTVQMLRRFRWELPPQDLALDESVLFPLPKGGLIARLSPWPALTVEPAPPRRVDGISITP